MKMTPLLLLFFQAAPPERTLDEAAAAFAKGDVAARTELLKATSCSVRPLRKVRDRAPDKVDALLYDVKKAAAGSDVSRLIAVLEAKRTMETPEADFSAAHAELADGLPLLFDPLLFRTHYDRKVKLKTEATPRRELLDSLCRQLDLDWGFVYGVVLIASPERLWPDTPPPRVAPLSEEESRRAAAWMDQLNDDQVERREEAAVALRKFGEGAIPLLEKSAERRDAEGAGRARDLIAQLRRPPPSGIFRAPAMDRQKLSGEDETIRRAVQQTRVAFKVSDIAFNGAVHLLLVPHKIPFETSRSLQDARVTLDVQGFDFTLGMVLCLASHAYGYDFMVQDGKLVFDTKEEIERRLAARR